MAVPYTGCDGTDARYPESPRGTAARAAFGVRSWTPPLVNARAPSRATPDWSAGAPRTTARPRSSDTEVAGEAAASRLLGGPTITRWPLCPTRDAFGSRFV